MRRMEKIYYFVVCWWLITKFSNVSSYSESPFDPDDDLDFCNTICNGIKHVACRCKSKMGCFVPEGITYDIVKYRKHILNMHNELRNEVALGLGESTTGSAANMNILSYDVGLEYTAGCNVKRCRMAHDLCSKTKRFENVGQNLYMVSGISSFTAKQIVEAGVRDWYKEAELIADSSIIDNFDESNKDVGHFTQLVWASATHVGCMVTMNAKEKKNFLCCNYASVYGDPSLAIQNLKDAKVYLKGVPASQCIGERKRNSVYPGLCGEQEPVPGAAFRLTAGFYYYFIVGSMFIVMFLEYAI